MPRTNSDLLQVDTMTAAKVDQFGKKIMELLQPFWIELDERDHRAMINELNILKNQSIANTSVDPFMPIENILPSQPQFSPVIRSRPRQGGYIRATPRFNRPGGFRGTTPRIFKTKTRYPNQKFTRGRKNY